MRLQGKTALITAAGQGIGKATALAFAKEGAQVWATDVNPKLLESYAGVANVQTAVLDVLDKAAIQKFTAGLPALNVLFNCAGFVANGTILDCDEATWDFSLDLNVKSMFRMCKAALPGMVARGHGNIINMASAVGSIIAAPNRFVYGVTKAGVIGLTKAIAADFVAKGIRCNAVCPGTVETPSLNDRMRAGGDYEAARKSFLARQPMGRMATAEEIAALVVFLASDESSYCTGSAHMVDGGWSNT
jgi:2-keto-3-deoxy-L-fuconate dehydrogenase